MTLTSRSVRLIRSSFRFRSVLGVFGVPTYFVLAGGVVLWLAWAAGLV